MKPREAWIVLNGRGQPICVGVVESMFSTRAEAEKAVNKIWNGIGTAKMTIHRVTVRVDEQR